MSALCQDVVSFADGELEPERAEAFRSHLATCAACRAALLEAMQLGARLGALPPPPQQLRLAPEPAAGTASEPVGPAPGGGRPRPKWRMLSPWSGAGLGAVALAAVALVAVFPRSHEPPASPFAALTTRPYDIRLAYRDVVSHRPKRDELRGAGGAGKSEISLAAQLALEGRGDKHGLAIARLYNSQSPAMLVEQLAELPLTPAIRADRAALESLSKSTDNADSVLAELDALRASADPVAARAARWNYAVLLSRLELPLGAAKAFHEIAEEHEAGWADEASSRAATEDKRAADARGRWDRALAAGEALVATGAPVPPELVAEVPSVMRVYLYDAVRTAPSRERVMALAPLAADLDRIAGQPVLGDYVRRVEGLDFRRRAPLASGYALVRGGGQPAPEILRALTDPQASADISDIVMGAMSKLGVVADHIDGYRAMVKQAGDPWFEIVLAQGEATAAKRHDDWLGEEARLRKAQALCSPAIDYLCSSLALQLATLYQELHRVPEAIAVAQSGLRTARGSGAWGPSVGLLFRLADARRFNASFAMARAYANEVLLMAPDNPGFYRSAQLVLVGIAIRDLDGRAARRALDLAVSDHSFSLSVADERSAANHLADIGRLDPQPGDLAQLRGWLGKMRAEGALIPAQLPLADVLEGRLLIETDRAAGTALIERAIVAAAALPRDVDAQKVRTAAYSMLVLDAARHGDPARAMALTAQELGRPTPGSCSVAMVAEDERSVVVVRGADGQDHAAYDSARRAGSGPPAVPADLARHLEGCGHVQVMAQAALQGQPHVLPANLAWSYTTAAGGATGPASHEPPPVQTLIVTDVMPPPELGLPPLSPRAIDAEPSNRTLSGPSATPTNVLAAMRDATEIQFHTHALVDLGVSDASYLVLSPGPDARYALTAEAIRGAELRGRPIIVLAACHAAQGARYQHAPWSLPDAFLAVGARAVFAAATVIPDLEAGPFFNRVLERVRAGAEPAVALRDERMASLASDPSSWVADVMVFE